MTGSSHICGLMACSNCRVLDTKKPHSPTSDAQIVVSACTEEIRLCCALLHHFHSATEATPIDKSMYYVSGKLASIPPDYKVGPGFDVASYDFLLEAERVRTCHSFFWAPIPYHSPNRWRCLPRTFPTQPNGRPLRSPASCALFPPLPRFDHSSTFSQARAGLTVSASSMSRITSLACIASPDTFATSLPQTSNSHRRPPFPQQPSHPLYAATSFARCLLQKQIQSNASLSKHTTLHSSALKIPPLCRQRRFPRVCVLFQPTFRHSHHFSATSNHYSWTLATTPAVVDKGKRKATDADDEPEPKPGPSTRRRRD